MSICAVLGYPQIRQTSQELNNSMMNNIYDDNGIPDRFKNDDYDFLIDYSEPIPSYNSVFKFFIPGDSFYDVIDEACNYLVIGGNFIFQNGFKLYKEQDPIFNSVISDRFSNAKIYGNHLIFINFLN